ncbi:MAG: hypothetical protein QOE55_2866 [Acidobacteriaceae bacterium]|nr:hypothetical protein [Acidobacteriaceae bacterium]
MGLADSRITEFAVIETVVLMKCRECSSNNVRRSRFRLRDLERLFLFQYPIRCRRCNRRDYVSLRRLLLPSGKKRDGYLKPNN